MTPDDPGRVAPRPGATIVLVVPGCNEGQGFCAPRDRSVAVMDRIPPHAWSCFLVDGGSRDASWSMLESFVAADARFKSLMFPRNFDKKVALTAGVEAALGAGAVIRLDALLLAWGHSALNVKFIVSQTDERYFIIGLLMVKICCVDSAMHGMGSQHAIFGGGL